MTTLHNLSIAGQIALALLAARIAALDMPFQQTPDRVLAGLQAA